MAGGSIQSGDLESRPRPPPPLLLLPLPLLLLPLPLLPFLPPSLLLSRLPCGTTMMSSSSQIGLRGGGSDGGDRTRKGFRRWGSNAAKPGGKVLCSLRVILSTEVFYKHN